MKLEIDLTPVEYQQLVECFFAGMMVLEELYPDSVASMEIGNRIHREAKKFGKEDLVFTAPEMGDFFTVGHEVEDRVLPILFPES